jgi:hypothetical protein
MVMATGIVSAPLHQAGWPGPAQVLLGGAAACFVVIVAAVGWRGRFVLWDGHDLGSGVLTRRIFV